MKVRKVKLLGPGSPEDCQEILMILVTFLVALIFKNSGREKFLMKTCIFHRQHDFSYQPGVAIEILENESIKLLLVS